MAVSEEELGSSQSHNQNNNHHSNGLQQQRQTKDGGGHHYLSKCVLKGSAILHAVYGHFRSQNTSEIVFGKETSIELVVIGEDGTLQSLCEQPVFGIIKDVVVLSSSEKQANNGKDLLLVLSDSGKLSFLRFSSKIHRFVAIAHVELSPPGNSLYELGRMLVLDKSGSFLAIAAYLDKIALFPIFNSVTSDIVGKKISYPAQLKDERTLPVGAQNKKSSDTIWSFCFISRDSSPSNTEANNPILAVVLNRSGEESNVLMIMECNCGESYFQIFGHYTFGGHLALSVSEDPNHCGFVLLFRMGDVLLLDTRDPYRVHIVSMVPLDVPVTALKDMVVEESYRTIEVDEEGMFSVAACALLELSDTGKDALKQEDLMNVDCECDESVVPARHVYSYCWASECSASSQIIVCIDNGELFMLDVSSDGEGRLKVSISGCLYKGSICRALLWAKGGFVAGLVEMGDGVILRLGDGELRYQSTIQNISPIFDFSVVDYYKEEQDQIFACSGRECDGSLRVIRNGINIEKLLRTAPIYQGITGLWSLRMRKTDEFHSFVVLSFVEETRVLSVGVSFHDVTDATGFMPESSTLECGLVKDGVFVQICWDVVRICLPTVAAHPEGVPLSSPVCKSWKPGILKINLGAVGKDHIVVSTSNPCYLFVLGIRSLSASDYELFEIAHIKLQTEVSCIYVPQDDGNAGAFFKDSVLKHTSEPFFLSASEIERTIVIGTHKPSVELLKIVPGGELKVIAVASITFVNAFGTILSWCIPQDVRIVLLDHFYVLSGLRNGMLLWFQWPMPSSTQSSDLTVSNSFVTQCPSTTDPPTMEFPVTCVDPSSLDMAEMSETSVPIQLQLVVVRRIGVTPVSLVSLHESLTTDIIALCERPWLLQTARHSQRINYTSISFQPASHVTPVRAADFPDGLLFVAENSLHLVELVHMKRLNVQKIDLGRTPRRIIYHKESQKLLVLTAGSSCHICLVDPLSGLSSVAFTFDPGEAPVCMQLLKVGNDQVLSVGTITTQATMPGGEAESVAGRFHVFSLETLQIPEGSSLAWGSRSGSSTQITSPFREIVGYAAEEFSNSSLCSSPDDNVDSVKLEDAETLQLRLINFYRLPGAVVAICPYMDHYFLLSTGNILSVYTFVNDNPHRIRKLASARTRSTIASLTACHNRIAVGDSRDGILFYSYIEDQNKLELLYCDPFQRLVADCTLVDFETAFVSDRQGKVSVLSSASHLEDTACPERNLSLSSSYFLGETIRRIRKERFSYRLPHDTMEGWANNVSVGDPLDNGIVACTLLGSVMIFVPLSREEYDLLKQVQAKIAVYRLTAPILGNDHAEFRGRGSQAGVPQILDGDLLCQLLELPTPHQEAILSLNLIDTSSLDFKFVASKPSPPVEKVIQLLERIHNAVI